MTTFDNAAARNRSPAHARLITVIAIANIALFAVYLGTILVLLPKQIEAIDPSAKIASLGWAGGLAALAAAVGTPLFGAMSDRTRSSWGRRTPWLLGGSAVAALAMLGLSQARSVVVVVALWCVIQFALSAYLAALIAIIPDRIPSEARGRASAAVGLGPAAGGLVGTMIAASLQDHLWVAYGVLACGPFLAAVLMVMGTRDGSRIDPVAPAIAIGRQQIGIGRYLGDRDFMWLFLGRACIILGIFLVQDFYFFILQDHIVPPRGMTPAAAVAELAFLNSVAMIAATVIGGWLSDRLDRRKIFVAFASLAFVVAAVIPIIVPSWSSLMIFALLSGIGIGAYWSVDTAMVTLVLPGEGRHAQDMAVMGIANAAPQAIAPLVGGLTIASLGYSALFGLAAVLCLICSLSVLPVRSVR